MLAEVHEAARDLHSAGTIDALTMRRLDVLCLPPVRHYTAADIQRIRKESNVSQAVFATILNVGKATVAAWEQGGKEPSGPALKLLDFVERKGAVCSSVKRSATHSPGDVYFLGADGVDRRGGELGVAKPILHQAERDTG